MNKNSIKIVKRKDAEATANAKTQSVLGAKQTVPFSEETTERRSRREIVGTITNWISERRENNRLEKIAAIRKMFGGEHLASEI